MLSLLSKEIKSFLYSFIGYIVMVVFLLFTGLLLWCFPFETNILENGFSNIDPLFIIAPWIFLFLIPSITMRSFADEKKTGTIELLLTRPITDMQIVFAKYFAGVLLVLLSLIPTLVYYYSVSKLGSPEGNIDTGGMWGSYIGLLFIGSAYVAIGIFSSSITDNQIVSFIVSVCLCIFMFYGFETLGSFDLFSGIDTFVISLGINDHYRSMSRGVIDSRDVIYFLSVIGVFLLFTRTTLESRKW